MVISLNGKASGARLNLQFMSTPTLSAVDKFQYLISLLDGPALAAVAGLKLTEPNYNEAIDTLTKRFGNKQLIICRHMDTLLELEPVVAPTNIKALHFSPPTDPLHPPPRYAGLKLLHTYIKLPKIKKEQF